MKTQGQDEDTVDLAQETELALMQQVRDGDHEAFTRLFTCFRQRVRRHAHALLQSAADAEDIVQDVFTALYTQNRHPNP